MNCKERNYGRITDIVLFDNEEITIGSKDWMNQKFIKSSDITFDEDKGVNVPFKKGTAVLEESSTEGVQGV